MERGRQLGDEGELLVLGGVLGDKFYSQGRAPVTQADGQGAAMAPVGVAGATCAASRGFRQGFEEHGGTGHWGHEESAEDALEREGTRRTRVQGARARPERVCGMPIRSGIRLFAAKRVHHVVL